MKEIIKRDVRIIDKGDYSIVKLLKPKIYLSDAREIVNTIMSNRSYCLKNMILDYSDVEYIENEARLFFDENAGNAINLKAIVAPNDLIKVCALVYKVYVSKSDIMDVFDKIEEAESWMDHQINHPMQLVKTVNG